jgi:hypothetical protein
MIEFRFVYKKLYKFITNYSPDHFSDTVRVFRNCIRFWEMSHRSLSTQLLPKFITRMNANFNWRIFTFSCTAWFTVTHRNGTRLQQFLDLASGLHVRSMAGSSRAVVASALWEGDLGPCSNPYSAVWFAVSGLYQIHSAVCWIWPGLKTQTVLKLAALLWKKRRKKKRTQTGVGFISVEDFCFSTFSSRYIKSMTCIMLQRMLWSAIT